MAGGSLSLSAHVQPLLSPVPQILKHETINSTDIQTHVKSNLERVHILCIEAALQQEKEKVAINHVKTKDKNLIVLTN